MNLRAATLTGTGDCRPLRAKDSLFFEDAKVVC